MAWREVSKREPCPVCGKPDWCGCGSDGAARCMRGGETPPGYRFVRDDPDGGRVFIRTEAAPSTNGRGVKATKSKTVYATVDDAIAAASRVAGCPEPSHRWTYTNAAGEQVGVVLRFNKADGGKSILPVARNCSGWLIGAMPEPRPLYGLAELSEHPGERVFIAEGERCADSCRALGLAALTSAGGSMAAAKADWTPLQGRRVVVLPDRDEPGMKYASDVARLARAAGATEVRIVQLSERWPDLPTGGDIADLVDGCGDDRHTLDALRAGIEKLAEEARVIAPIDDDGEESGALPPMPDILDGWCAGDYFASVAEALQVPPELVTMTGLATAAAAAGGLFEVRIAPDWSEPLNLYALCIAEPGERKSAAFAEILAPLRAWESDEATRLRAQVTAGREHRTMLEKRTDYLRGKASRADDAGERDRMMREISDVAEELERLDIPALPALLMDDSTPEALALAMQSTGGRAFIAAAEGDALDIALGRYAKDSSMSAGALLRGHAGEPLRVHRVGRETIDIVRTFVSVALSIQPDAALRLYGHAAARGRGLTARFLVAWPQSRLGFRELSPASIDTDAREVWRRSLRWLLDSPRPDEPHALTLDPEAAELFADFRRTHETELRPGGRYSGRTGWASKLTGALARIAGVLWLLQRAEIGKATFSPAIDADTMRAALSMADYLDAHHRKLEGVATLETQAEQAEALLRALRDAGETGLTPRELRNANKARWSTPDDARAALEAAVSSGQVARVDTDGGSPGRPTTRYRLETGVS